MQMEKGIDPGIRGDKDSPQSGSYLIVLPGAGTSDAILLKNLENQGNPVMGDLATDASYTELSVCVRFKFVTFLPDRYSPCVFDISYNSV